MVALVNVLRATGAARITLFQSTSRPPKVTLAVARSSSGRDAFEVFETVTGISKTRSDAAGTVPDRGSPVNRMLGCWGASMEKLKGASNGL